MLSGLFRALAATLMAVHAAGDLLKKQSLEAVDSLAVCNDGTPAVYYYKEARSNASRTWLVFLESGGQCYDNPTCEERCQNDPGRCSSKDYPPSLSLHGIFSPHDNEDLFEAHKVFVKYCTSDAHMGNALAFNRSFRGKIVVQSVLQSLVTKGLGSGLNGRDRLIFGGGSAGARGAMIHLDYVQQMLGTAAAANVDIVGFLDSPAYIDMAPLDSSFQGFPYQTQQIYSYANVEHLGDDCQTMYPDDEWKCMYGQYRLPTLKTRFFLVASLEDSYQLENDIGDSPPFSSEAELAYVETFANATRSLGDTIVAMPAHNAVYSWACYDHAMSVDNNGFNKRTCNGTTMTAAFKQFLDGDAASSLMWRDACTTFRCGCASIDRGLKRHFRPYIP